MVALALVLAMCPVLSAQYYDYGYRSVGGIAIDASGALDNATVDELGKLSRLRVQVLKAAPDSLNAPTELRKVSLRRLEAAIEKCMKDDGKLPDEINLLAGLQRIDYVFVYPKQQDIVLVGPAEGWKVDKRGNIVGIGTGRPVMLLDDLLVALRTARQAANGGISCSIDPTAAGLQRLRSHVGNLRTIGNPTATAASIENTLGPQEITVHGVPATSHFARVLVAADYRMKRLAMNFDKPPVRGLPSYLSMMKATGRGMRNMLPRWWLEPKYEPLLRDPDGLAWQLRGASVMAKTEEDFLAAGGQRRHTGRAAPTAQKWADNMTAKYDELAVADPVFGELRNCMELAVVGALVVKERLTEKAGYSMPLLLDPAVKVAEFNAPKQVASKASLMKKGSNWVISASGGVQVNSWQVAHQVEQAEAPAKARAKAVPAENANWWWN